MKLPSNSASRTLISVSHLQEAAPTHPGTSARAGNPWCVVSGAPFMCVAIRVSESSAFSMGMLRTKGGTLPGTSSSPRNITCLPVVFTPPRCNRSRNRGPENLAVLVHVVAHEEVRNGRDPSVEIFDRGLQIQKAVRAKNHAILARHIDGASRAFGRCQNPCRGHCPGHCPCCEHCS